MEEQKKQKNINDLQTNEKITWCRGCGNFGIFVALRKAILELNIPLKDIVVAYGIGCHGHMVNYLKIYGFEGLHGRALPVAEGIKMANKKLTVLAVAGDGDLLGEGVQHLVHAIRRNINITCILHDNQLYALTVNEASPRTEKGMKTRSTPEGNYVEPINPISFALGLECSFVARGFSGDVNHLTEIIKRAVNHNGFAFIDVLQPCVTFNYINTFQYFFQRVYKLEETDYDPTNLKLAFEKSFEWGDKIPIGVFYEKEKSIFTDDHPLLSKIDSLKDHKPLSAIPDDLLNVFK